MPQMRTKKISADEARSKREAQVKDTPRGAAIMKAAKGPPSWDATARSARFVMSTQQVDRYGDIVVTNGIDTTAFEQNPAALLCHNSRDWPIGEWQNLEKMLKGRPVRLEGDCVLLPEGGPVPEIDMAAWMIANGGIKACSIGFVPDWENCEMILDDEGHWTGGLQFNTSELIECSICPVPANPGALVKSANGNLGLARELIEDILDNYARTPEGLLVPRAEFEKAYKTLVSPAVPAAQPAKKEKAAELPVEESEIEAADVRSIEFEVAKLVPAIAGGTAVVDGAVKAKLQVVNGKWKHVGDHKEGDVANFCVICTEKDGKRAYDVSGVDAAGALPRAKRVGDVWQKLLPAGRHAVTVDKSLCRAPKTVKGERVQAKSQAEAEVYNGAKVRLDPSHAENKGWPFDLLLKAEGEVLLSYIVEEGEKKGVHALWVEFLTDDYEGMFRGIAADRFLVVPEAAPAESETKQIIVSLQVDQAVKDEIEGEVTSFASGLREKIAKLFTVKTKSPDRVEPKLDTSAPPSAEEIAAVRAAAAATRTRLAQQSLI